MPTPTAANQRAFIIITILMFLALTALAAVALFTQTTPATRYVSPAPVSVSGSAGVGSNSSTAAPAPVVTVLPAPVATAEKTQGYDFSAGSLEGVPGILPFGTTPTSAPTEDSSSKAALPASPQTGIQTSQPVPIPTPQVKGFLAATAQKAAPVAIPSPIAVMTPVPSDPGIELGAATMVRALWVCTQNGVDVATVDNFTDCSAAFAAYDAAAAPGSPLPRGSENGASSQSVSQAWECSWDGAVIGIVTSPAGCEILFAQEESK
ncbi:hypothetical protein [Subtercola boreus]|uniref:hypothetical protein n=1 Tax=Subtercola boreus TaxID=120213 RepID=UPI001151FCF6|nr:hypothetical protein [Subtercola boreus]TQL55046.1 hypothetical protein FB464_2601 [Subtercola boreus]